MYFVSIIIPHFNLSHLLAETVQSLFDQTYKDFEVIVVDDGSELVHWQELQRLKELWPELKVFRRPDDLVKGANSCRNYGFLMSKGDFINFVDGDDVFLPDKLEKQIGKFKEDPLIDMLVCKTRYFRESVANQLNQLQKVEFSENTDFLNHYLSRLGVWCTNSALIKRAAISETKFKEGQLVANEWVFFIKLMLKNAKVSAVNEVLVLKRQHSDTLGNLNMRVKLPFLLESRRLIFLDLLAYNHVNKEAYLKLLVDDVNSLLKTAGKLGEFKEFMNTVRFFKLNAIQELRSIILYYVFWITKRGNQLKVIERK